MFFTKIFSKKKKANTGLKEIQAGRFTILANQEHPLQDYLNNHKYYSRNLPRIAKLLEAKYKTYNIIDVGANIGDTIALVRSADCDQFIYAIEGDPVYFEILEKNALNFKGVKTFQTFLGEETGSGNFSVETTKGTANLVQLEDSTTSIQKLDDLVSDNGIKNVKLLKIDTDGFDFKILRGSWDLLKNNRPVLFFEYDASYLEKLGESGTELLFDLYHLGYRTAIYYDNYGKLLLSVSLENQDIVKQLYAYMRKGEGAFYYYDVCLFHEDDNELAKDIIASELQFFY
ncbi:FkbM family methyltransferase [Mucilaginibacter sp. AW1-3]